MTLQLLPERDVQAGQNSDVELHREAVRVLLDNWRGAWTVPSSGLYPHQWSWDSALICIGLVHVSERRARLELSSLLGAQWADGRVPQIVFDPAVPEGAYFPGPAFWRSSEVAGSALVPTSGIVQPPVHAVAALEVYRASRERAVARDWLTRLYPRLVAWQRYLTTSRDVAGDGLPVIVHPWESGRDNSPDWDEPLAAVRPDADVPLVRPDLQHSAAADRPQRVDYGRYVALAELYRSHGYRDRDLLSWHPFVVTDPLFVALTAWSEYALAEIAAIVDADPAEQRSRSPSRSSLPRRLGRSEHLARGRALTDALCRRLYDPAAGLFRARDVRTGRFCDASTVGGLIPLVLPDLPVDIMRRLVETLTGPRFGLGAIPYPVPSNDLTAASFDPRRYWRGPSWLVTSWLVWRGLLTASYAEEAARLREAMLAAVRRSGFREYVDPLTGEGRGCDGFSWTAALTLDLFAQPRSPVLAEGRLLPV